MTEFEDLIRELEDAQPGIDGDAYIVSLLSRAIDAIKNAYEMGYDKGFSDNYSEGEGV